MRTKEDFRRLLDEGQRRVPNSLTPQGYILKCVEVMFDLAAEVLADLEKDRKK